MDDITLSLYLSIFSYSLSLSLSLRQFKKAILSRNFTDLRTDKAVIETTALFISCI